jgi:hypothetical protein
MNTDPSDPNSFLNQYHVPEDAGEHAEDLRKILERIPLRWGRWISCGPGWYPFIIELDRKLAEIAPDYQLHQVKEKFGTLRYYIGFPEIKAQCCIDIEATQPVEGAVSPYWVKEGSRTAKEQYELDKWFYKKFLPHLASEEHDQQFLALEPERQRQREQSEQMEKIIQEYEDISARTCEKCGQSGETLVNNYWYRTLCSTCAETQGYMPIPENSD